MSEKVAITLNGEAHEVEAGARLLDVLAGLGLDPRRVAVERNREVVPRRRLAEVTVEEGDTYEVVQFVGGG